ncbi:hypothetical protein TWF696_004877 [Orbilia brochopaga]|uniref:Zn(2)-C6 fungal-type domain-containing protein n=1 Tax=Orbilia brochopaga TaxID=3140254 RepID=A0AAV9V5K6_9PEZI
MEPPCSDTSTLLGQNSPNVASNTEVRISSVIHTQKWLDLSPIAEEYGDISTDSSDNKLAAAETIASPPANEALVQCCNMELKAGKSLQESGSPWRNEMEMERTALPQNDVTLVEGTHISKLPNLNTREYSAPKSVPTTCNPKIWIPQIASLEPSGDDDSYPPPTNGSCLRGIYSSTTQAPQTTTASVRSTSNTLPLPTPFIPHKPAEMAKPGPKPSAKRGRKRKNHTTATAELAKVKRVRTDPKRPAACKLCYEKHVGCERQSEDDPCRACTKRKVACEPNDVKVIKGVRRRAATTQADDHHDINTSEGRVNRRGQTGSDVLETENEEATQAGAEVIEISSRFGLGAGPGRAIDASGGDVEASPEARSENENISTQVPTEREIHAANILASLKHAEANLLDCDTCIRYFQTIREVLLAEGRSENRVKEALNQLEQLQVQFLWLARGT